MLLWKHNGPALTTNIRLVAKKVVTERLASVTDHNFTPVRGRVYADMIRNPSFTEAHSRACRLRTGRPNRR